MAAGRPTLFSDEMIREGWAYVQNTNDAWDEKNQRLKVNVPTVEGLALHLEVTRSTVYLWQKEHEQFSDIIETLLQKQAQSLINNGLSGGYNSTIAKVLLTKHGYTDKQEIDQSTRHSGEINHSIDYSKLSESALREIASLDKPKESQD